MVVDQTGDVPALVSMENSTGPSPSRSVPEASKANPALRSISRASERLVRPGEGAGWYQSLFPGETCEDRRAARDP
jgi:hypothetical protein